MRFRGIERWYEMDTVAYMMTRSDWEKLAAV